MKAMDNKQASQTSKKATRPYHGQSFYLLFGSFMGIIFICFALVIIITVHNAARTANVTKNMYHDTSYAAIDSVSRMTTSFDEFGDMLANYDSAKLLLSELSSMDRETLEQQDMTNLMISYFSLYSSANQIPGAIIYLYFRRSNYAMRLGGTGEDAIAGGEISDILGITDTDWNLLTSAGKTTVCIIEQTEAMAFPRLMLARQIADNTVMIDAVPGDTITRLIDDHYLPENASALLFSSNGQYLLSGEGLPEGIALTYDDFTGEKGERDILPTADRRTYFVYYADIPNTSLKMAVIIKDTLTGSLRSSAVKTILIALLLWVGIGGLLSWLFARRIYRPVSVLMARLPEDPDAPDNDFVRLQYFVDSLVNRNVSYEEKLRRQRYLLSSSLFLRLLNTTIGWTSDVTKYMAESAFPMDSQRYRLFALLLLADENPQIAGSMTDIPYTLCARFKEVLKQQGFDAFIVHGEESYIGFLDLTGRNDLPDFARFHEMDTELGMIRCCAAVSDSFTALEDLPRSYAQVLSALDALLLPGTPERGRTLFYADIPQSFGAAITNAFLPSLNRTSNRIEAADYDGAVDALHDTFAALASGALTEKERRSRLDYLLQTLQLVISCLPEMDQDKLRKFMSNYPSSPDGSMTRTQNRLEEIIRALPDCRSNTDEDSLLVAQIREYVQKNCTDSLISAGAAAEHFQVSLPWLSVHFKQQSGVGFLDYLHACRLNLAKQKLLQTNDSMQEIALACGYTSAATFSRTFRKYEGVTPTWYRQNHTDP